MNVAILTDSCASIPETPAGDLCCLTRLGERTRACSVTVL